MWQRFTQPARRVIFSAQEEAGRMGENKVSTEHLLLGLLKTNDAISMRVLENLGVSPQHLQREVERLLKPGRGLTTQDMHLTQQGHRVVDLAYNEARTLKHDYIGTEHLLLGLIREERGIAGRVLREHNVSLERARREVVKWLEASILLRAGEAPETSPKELVRPAANASTTPEEELLRSSEPEAQPPSKRKHSGLWPFKL